MKVLLDLKMAGAVLCGIMLTISCSSDNDEKALPVADFTTKVEGYKATFINLSERGITYHWDFGDGNESTQKDPEHVYTAGGEFEVVLKVTNSDGSDETTKTVEIVELYLGDRINIDGKFEDWAGITSFKPMAEDAYQSLKEIKVASNNQYIYIYAKMQKAVFETGYISTFLDYDLSVSTGYKPWFADAGFESFAQSSVADRDAALYFYTGNPGEANWMWDELVSMGSGFNTWSTPKETGDDVEVEFSLDKSKIQGLSKAVGLSFYLEKDWATQGLIPSTGEKPILLNLEKGTASLQE